MRSVDERSRTPDFTTFDPELPSETRRNENHHRVIVRNDKTGVLYDVSFARWNERVSKIESMSVVGYR